MKTKIIPFDLETAKKIQEGVLEGKIKTKSGKNARIICWDMKNEHHTPIVALIDNKQREEFYIYSEAGEYDFGSYPMRNLVLEIPDNEPQFKPFDKVLVRDSDDEEWTCAIFSHTTNLEQPYACVGNIFVYQCIPYEGNEDLVGTINKPKED